MKLISDVVNPFLAGVMQGFIHVALQRRRERREERCKAKEAAAAAAESGAEQIAEGERALGAE